MSYAELFFTFLYVGTFTIGGGLVALTLMQQQLVTPRFITPDRFYSMVAVSESTPGPIGINMATYLGFEYHGIPGALVATAGTVLPSLVVIIIIARFFHVWRELPWVRAMFYGLRAGTTGMIAVAAWQVLTVAVFPVARFQASGRISELIDLRVLVFFAAVCIAYKRFQLHPAVYILCGAVFGIVFL